MVSGMLMARESMRGRGSVRTITSEATMAMSPMVRGIGSLRGRLTPSSIGSRIGLAMIIGVFIWFTDFPAWITKPPDETAQGVGQRARGNGLVGIPSGGLRTRRVSVTRPKEVYISHHISAKASSRFR